jgi:transcriptional regulator with XRE-family HTH domain
MVIAGVVLAVYTDVRLSEPIRMDRPQRSRVNIGEIARRSGVSRSTVSYALSGKRAVSEATRQRIQAVIDELGY